LLHIIEPLVDCYDIITLYYENELMQIGGKMKLEVQHQRDGLEQIPNDHVLLYGMYQVKVNGKLHVILFHEQVVRITL